MKLRLKPPSPAMAVACLALLVALGGTSYAAVAIPANSVGTRQLKANAVTSAKIDNGTIQTSDLSSRAVTSLKGATGPQGPAGSALAYGDVPATVSDGGIVHYGWTGAVDHISTGIYCLSGFSGTLNNVVVSVDASAPDDGADAQAEIGHSYCSSNTQIEVQTYNGDNRANEPFDFAVN